MLRRPFRDHVRVVPQMDDHARVGLDDGAGLNRERHALFDNEVFGEDMDIPGRPGLVVANAAGMHDRGVVGEVRVYGFADDFTHGVYNLDTNIVFAGREVGGVGENPALRLAGAVELGEAFTVIGHDPHALAVLEEPGKPLEREAIIADVGRLAEGNHAVLVRGVDGPVLRRGPPLG